MVEINSQVSMISFFGASYSFLVLWCESWAFSVQERMILSCSVLLLYYMRPFLA